MGAGSGHALTRDHRGARNTQALTENAILGVILLMGSARLERATSCL